MNQGVIPVQGNVVEIRRDIRILLELCHPDSTTSLGGILASLQSNWYLWTASKKMLLSIEQCLTN